MKKGLIDWCLLGLVVAMLTGCSTPKMEASQKSAGYTGALSDVLVVIDGAHLAKAFRDLQGFNSGDPSAQTEKSTRATAAIKQAIAEALTKQGVSVSAEVVDLSNGLQPLTTLIVASKKRQLLVLTTKGFQTSTTTRTSYGVYTGGSYNGWTGKLTWTVTLNDFDRTANPTGRAVWKADTSWFDFGPGLCAYDGYKQCAGQFVDVVIEKMREDNLLPARK